MFHDLDRTLAELLKRGLPPSLVNQVTLSFATPDEEFPPSSVNLPAIDFFLYDVRENMDLRNTQWQTERHQDGTGVRHHAPMRVDCSYLITAWPSKNVADPADDEHRLLGEVLRVLLRHRVLPAEVLQGSLQGQDPPARGRVLMPGHLQSIGEFWQALGGKPKVMLPYVITVSLEMLEPVEVGRLVTDKRLTFQTERLQ